jgi:hypothetical protein
LLFGLILLFVEIVVDIYFFVNHLYMKGNEKLSRFQRHQISVPGLIELLDHTKKTLKTQKHLGEQGLNILMVDFVNEFRDILDVDRKIYNIIFGQNVIRTNAIKKTKAFELTTQKTINSHSSLERFQTLKSIKSYFTSKFTKQKTEKLVLDHHDDASEQSFD